jgi:hypothetical protein
MKDKSRSAGPRLPGRKRTPARTPMFSTTASSGPRSNFRTAPASRST